MEFQIIQTDRLQLRKLDEAAHHFIFNHYSDAQLMHFLGLSTPEELLKEQEKYRQNLTTYNKKMVNFQMILTQTDTIIGHCGFHTWYTDHRRAEIGYALNADAVKQKGFMSEALAPVIAYGFQTMQLHRIEAFIGPDNIASLKLVEHLGFQREGHLKEHYFKKGKMEDSLIYALLQPDFRSAQAQ
jgi:[ribosomal protein S5]-alanine N-acetyltransferase